MKIPITRRASLIGLAAACLAVICSAETTGADSRPNGRIRPDIVVAADGSGDFTTVQAAIDSIPKDNTQRVLIFIKNGVYSERVLLDRNYVTLEGQSRAGTRIEFPLPMTIEDKPKYIKNLGIGIVNITGNDAILEDLTLSNTQPSNRIHAFTLFGSQKCTRTVLLRCDVLSNGSDTVSLWGNGFYYHADCLFVGGVDYVCPTGWCYITRSKFLQCPLGNALWHNGQLNEDMKFVVCDSYFDGADDHARLGRYTVPSAQFYLIADVFSKNVRTGILNPPRNLKMPEWGRRVYFYGCHTEGGDQPWHANNLDQAKGSPTPGQITAAWTFGGRWDPETTVPPKVTGLKSDDGSFKVSFAERVTVKGRPVLRLQSGEAATYVSGSGSDTLVFRPSHPGRRPQSFDQSAGVIIASLATVNLRQVADALPAGVIGNP